MPHHSSTFKKNQVKCPYHFHYPSHHSLLAAYHGISNSGGVFISHEFTERSGLETFPLKKAISVRNVDGTPNKKGTISHYAKGELEVNGRKFLTSFLITGLGEESVILGLPWLQKINPIIDWKKGTFEFWEDL